MKNYKIFAATALCAALILTACGSKKEADTTSIFEPIGDAAVSQQEASDKSGEQDTASNDNGSSVPSENETADGFMGAYLQASDKDKIDTTNEAGVLYKVVYDAAIDGDDLIIYGAMDYRNDKGQDSMTVSSDLKHIFKVTDETVYQMVGGEAGAEAVSKEDFSEYLKNLIDSGLFLDIEVKDGVVVSASINS
ncbi:MAG: hypothetical protein K6E91_05005 [Butyrivibrio sp.]|nr:hypothetical protein [Butyrivibrio sp.]